MASGVAEAIQAGVRRAVEFCKSRAGSTFVELAIQFSISNPDIATTLVGTAESRLMLENIRYAAKPIDQEKLALVMDVLKPIHNFNFARGREENRDPLVG